jgi:hypothetical protein
VYGEWIKIRFPRKCYVQDVLYTPFSLATSIGQGYLLGSNDEYDWEPVYPINKTFINLNEMSLINVGGVLPAIYTGTSKAFQYFIFMATTIQGTSGAAAGSTEKFAITNLRFTLYDSWVYHDNIISVGTFPLGTPVSNALDVNGNAYVSGQIITEGGINVLSGDINITGEFRKNGAIFSGGATTFDAGAIISGTLAVARIPGLPTSIITSGAFPVDKGGTGQSIFTTGRPIIGNLYGGLQTSQYFKHDFTYNRTSIGTTNNGTHLLEIGAGGSTISQITGVISQRWFNGANALTLSSGSFTVAMKVNGNVWTTASFTSSSDSRIKEDIQDINDDSALQMILAIEPKTYKYIDKIEKGNKKVYGFIAQQIRQVIPDATSIQKSYIPNIVLLADYDNKIITLPSQPTKVIIKLNDKIKCYDKYDKEVFVEVEEVIDELTFRIKELETAYVDNKIFVSGTEIDDFHTLTKEYIFTLNVCATQELHRKIKSQEDRIKELEAKVERLLNYISL